MKIEALAQLGDMLKNMEKNKGRQLASRYVGGSTKELPKDPAPTLKELKIDKKTSMVAQQLAAMPEATRHAIENDFSLPLRQ